MRIRLEAQARRDLDSIARQGEDRWGTDATRRYVGDLLGLARRLADMPGIGRRRDEIRAGLRSIPQGTHLILYRIDDDAITILAIPHQAADPDGYL